MSMSEFHILAERARSNAEALRDKTIIPSAALAEVSRLILDLDNYAMLTKRASSMGEREIHHATSFVLQSTERWARYLQYENEQDRADDWCDATFAFIALLKNAVSREEGRAA